MHYRTLQFSSVYDLVEAERLLIDKGVPSSDLEMDFRGKLLYVETETQHVSALDNVADELHAEQV